MAWLWPSVGAAVLLLGVAILRGRYWLRNPAFWLGGLFLSYLLIQWVNAGRELYFDVGLNQWVFSPARYPRLPFAISRREAGQMLLWFFPAWSLVTVLRDPTLSRRLMERLFLGVIYGSGVLAVFGIIQYCSGTSRMYWLAQMNAGFFASFGYTNHAAAYFVTVAMLGFGYFFHEILHPVRPIRRVRAALLAGSVGLCIIAANLSLSRAGIVLSWIFLLFSVWIGLRRGLARFSPGAKFNLILLSAGALAALVMAVTMIAGDNVPRQFAVSDPEQTAFLPGYLQRLDLAPGRIRYDLAAASARLWQDYPWFGVGGWGFRHFLAFYVPEYDWGRVVIPAGRANVHNDYLQFLAEFGVIGFGIGMIGVPLWLWIGMFVGKHPPRRELVLSFAVMALGVPMVFALWDLPFRCPAILYLWCAILAGLPTLAASHAVVQGEVLSN